MYKWAFKKLLILFAGISFILICANNTKAESIPLTARVEGNANGPLLFFVHGSPGSAESFSDYFSDEELKKKAQLVAIDRPGYGELSKKLSKLSVDEQAKLFNQYIKTNYPNREVILVGHSYGAPVAAQMASAPEARYKSVVLMSPIADPREVKKDKVIKTLRVLRPALEKAVPDKHQHRLTSPIELIALEKDLESISGSWEKIRSKIILINGDKDKRVSYKNIQFINEKVGPNNLPEIKILANQGHSIPKSGSLEVRDILIREISENDKSNTSSMAVRSLSKVSVKRCESLFGKVLKTARP